MQTPSTLALAALLAFAVPVSAAPAADARFKAIYTQEWTWRTGQYLVDSDNNEAIDKHLPRVDAAAQAARLAYWEGVMRQLDGVPQASLSPAARIDYLVYRSQVAALIAAQRFREYEKPLNADSTFWTDLSYTARQTFRTAKDYRNYLQQLAEVPRYFDEQTANMRAGLARGFTPPRVTLTGRDVSLSAVAEAKTPRTPCSTRRSGDAGGDPRRRAGRTARPGCDSDPRGRAAGLRPRAEVHARGVRAARAHGAGRRPACPTARPITSRRSSSTRPPS
jgi:uncharacterized protein (DUF885 family)